MLELDVNKVDFIITKAREFEAPEGTVRVEHPVKAVEDDYEEILNDNDDLAAPEEDATFDELKSWINTINDDDQCQIVALTWVGRGDFQPDDWDEALSVACNEHNDRTAEYLLGMPLLPDYLEEGLSQFGLR